jgi:hypothetical protein
MSYALEVDKKFIDMAQHCCAVTDTGLFQAVGGHLMVLKGTDLRYTFTRREWSKITDTKQEGWQTFGTVFSQNGPTRIINILTFEQVLDYVDEELRTKLLFHLDLFT